MVEPGVYPRNMISAVCFQNYRVEIVVLDTRHEDGIPVREKKERILLRQQRTASAWMVSSQSRRRHRLFAFEEAAERSNNFPTPQMLTYIFNVDQPHLDPHSHTHN